MTTNTTDKRLAEYFSDYETGTVVDGITVWSWKPVEGNSPGLSGISPAGPVRFCQDLERYGHVIVASQQDPAKRAHYMAASSQIAHQDAEFAETGQSHAAWVENAQPDKDAELWRTEWWRSDSSYRRQYGNIPFRRRP